MGLSSSREGHHHQSNQEEVQESMKTSSWSRSPGSIDISAFPQEVVRVFFFLFFRLSDFFEICMTTFGKRADGQGGQNERRGWKESKSADTENLSDAIK